MDVDNEDYGKPVADYFGVSGDGPKVSPSFRIRTPLAPTPPLASVMCYMLLDL